MIDPMLSLAFTIHANPGVYALFIASGVSRTSGIPTGWEIVLDLVRKLAALKGEDCTSEEEAWYRDTFGDEPNYSVLLNELAKTPAERKNLLYPYFEPTQDERERGIKVPTPAHRAIAELVSKGYFRIIFTTNFDSLMEDALRDVNVTPTVVSTPDSIKGMMPLSHPGCVIIKLHGDYRDTRILNTPDELEKYTPEIDELMDRILDEFGVIVCGWSADWDTAMRDAFARCTSHRFTTYWAARGNLSAKAQDVVDQRRGQVISITGADEFFLSLNEKIMSLEVIDRPHPLSAPIAAATLKRHLETHNLLRASDLMLQETERLYSIVSDPDLPAGGIHNSDAAQKTNLWYENISEVLISLMAHGCYWGDTEFRRLWTRCLARIGDPFGGEFSSIHWRKIRYYPATLLLYAGGIGAVANNKPATLAALLKTKCRDAQQREVYAALMLTYLYLDNEVSYYPPTPDGNSPLPLSSRLYHALYEPLSLLLPETSLYDRYFDEFEYLLFLVHSDLWDNVGSNIAYEYTPVGRFALDFGYRMMGTLPRVIRNTDAQVKRLGDKWPYFQVGLFGGSPERFQAARDKIEHTMQKRFR